jgi:hypothetical protein
MNDVILSADDALLRTTDEQVGVLLSYYEHGGEEPELKPGFVMRRCKSLQAFREVLRAGLSSRDILPKQQDSDVSAWQFFVDRFRGALHDEPLAVPLEEEKKLLDLCDELLEYDVPDREALAAGRDATLEAIEALRSQR